MNVNGTTISLVLGDITEQQVDVIVNAANSTLLGGGGVDGAIHRVGGPAIRKECESIAQEQGPSPPGSAVITTAGDLPASHVIHTVGPVWQGGEEREPDLLASCYRNSLVLAEEMGARTIAFPSISTGAFGYPVSLAAAVALYMAVNHARESTLADIRFVLFSKSDLEVYRSRLAICKEENE